VVNIDHMSGTRTCQIVTITASSVADGCPGFCDPSPGWSDAVRIYFKRAAHFFAPALEMRLPAGMFIFNRADATRRYPWIVEAALKIGVDGMRLFRRP
jgi:hypothetical protein